MYLNKYKKTLNCPICGKIREFSTRKGYNYAYNKKSICNVCSGKSKLFSNEHRQKISQSKIGNKNPMFGKIGFCGYGEHNPMWGKRGKDHPAYGRKHSDITIQKIKTAAIKKKNNDYREKISQLLMNKNKGKSHSDETKRKMRISRLKRMEALGIPQKEDIGSKNFFNNLNKIGFHFYPKRFMNIGYDADGYDEINHIWCEFDTPYHNVLNQQKKDLIRQQHIIEYFERNGCPLTAFLRVKSDKYGNVIKTTCVYNPNNIQIFA